MVTYHTMLLMNPRLIKCVCVGGGGGRGVCVLHTGRSFLLVFDLRCACGLLHKGCHRLLYPAIPREFFQVVSLYAMYSTSLAHHNKSNSQGKGWGGLIIGARGFIIFDPLQVNVPISSGVYKWGGGGGGLQCISARLLYEGLIRL